MHAEGIVARILKPCLTGIHAKRAAALRAPLPPCCAAAR
jgi:hypothetical protein